MEYAMDRMTSLYRWVSDETTSRKVSRATLSDPSVSQMLLSMRKSVNRREITAFSSSMMTYP